VGVGLRRGRAPRERRRRSARRHPRQRGVPQAPRRGPDRAGALRVARRRAARRMSEARAIHLTVNGELRRATVETRTTLVDFLRDGLRLTGTHVGCEQGVCGACTVLVDGEAVRGCLLLAVQADGARVDTVEGLAPGPEALNALQEEFVRHHGVQCGFCTAGILMSLT